MNKLSCQSCDFFYDDPSNMLLEGICPKCGGKCFSGYYTSVEKPKEEIKLSPEQVDPWSLEPARNIRKTFVQQGGLGSRVPIDGYYSPHDMKKYQCVHCKTLYKWTPDLDFTDFGEVVDNLCSACRKELRTMRTNHPEMV